MSPKPKILFVVTSHNELGNTGRKTGWYLVSQSLFMAAVSNFGS
jgi:hypothetical protein